MEHPYWVYENEMGPLDEVHLSCLAETANLYVWKLKPTREDWYCDKIDLLWDGLEKDCPAIRCCGGPISVMFFPRAENVVEGIVVEESDAQRAETDKMLDEMLMGDLWTSHARRWHTARRTSPYRRVPTPLDEEWVCCTSNRPMPRELLEIILNATVYPEMWHISEIELVKAGSTPYMVRTRSNNWPTISIATFIRPTHRTHIEYRLCHAHNVTICLETALAAGGLLHPDKKVDVVSFRRRGA